MEIFNTIKLENFNFTKTLNMKRKIFFFILSLLSIYVIFPKKIYAQTISMDDAIKYINSKVGNNYELVFENKQLLLTVLKNGKKYRTDKVYLADLDHQEVFYYHDMGMIVVKCMPGRENCVDKNLFEKSKDQKKSKREQTSRLSLTIDPNEKIGEGIKEAFAHMILLMKDFDYSRTEAFEKD